RWWNGASDWERSTSNSRSSPCGRSPVSGSSLRTGGRRKTRTRSTPSPTRTPILPYDSSEEADHAFDHRTQSPHSLGRTGGGAATAFRHGPQLRGTDVGPYRRRAGRELPRPVVLQPRNRPERIDS